MAEHKVSGRQARIRSSHRVVRFRRFSIKSAVGEVRPREKRSAGEDQKSVESWILELKELQVPRDGIVRAVSSWAEKLPMVDPQIADLKFMVGLYCRLWLGFQNPHVVQIYLHQRLNKMLNEKKQAAREAAVSVIRRGHKRPEVCRATIANVLKPLVRPDVERLVLLAIHEIRTEILEHAKNGPVVDCECGHREGNEVRRIRIRGSRNCFLVVRTSNKGPVVLTMQTEAEFKARIRRNAKARGEKRRSWRPDRNMFLQMC